MGEPTRGGRAEPSSRDQKLRRERGQKLEDRSVCTKNMGGRNDKTGHRQCCKSSGVSLTQSMREALKSSHEDPPLPKFDAESGDSLHEGGGVVAVGLHIRRSRK